MYKNDLMHPQNHLDDLTDEFYQPLPNKAGISLTKILGVKRARKKARVGKKKN